MVEINKNSSEECDPEKRDELIYGIINNRFNLEWERSYSLDGKASNIINFVGIIIGIEAGMGSTLLNDVPRMNDSYIYICTIFLLSIIFLTCSILSALKAYYVKHWKVVPDSKHLIEEYAKKDRSRIDILRIMSNEISNSIEHNEELNDEKAQFIRYALLFLVIGIIINILFIYGLMVI